MDGGQPCDGQVEAKHLDRCLVGLGSSRQTPCLQVAWCRHFCVRPRHHALLSSRILSVLLRQRAQTDDTSYSSRNEGRQLAVAVGPHPGILQGRGRPPPIPKTDHSVSYTHRTPPGPDTKERSALIRTRAVFVVGSSTAAESFTNKTWGSPPRRPCRKTRSRTG